MTHYDADAITRFAHEEEVPGAAEFHQHIAVCSQCAAEFQVAREVELALRDRSTWLLTKAVSRSVKPPEWLVQRETDRARQHSQVISKLQPRLVSPTAFKQTSLENMLEFQSDVVIQALSEASEELRTTQPKFALLVATTAVTIATKLQAAGNAVSRSIVGRAWCQRAFALLALSRYREADEAATRAEKEFDADPTSTPHDTAIVWLNRAILCVETERTELAEELARDAARVFDAYGDGTRLLNALLLEGNILYMRKEYARGAAVLEKLIIEARQKKKLVVLGMALQNAGLCYAGLHDWGKAEPYYFEALVLWDELGEEANRVRINWALASLLLNTGRFEEAIPRFREAWRRLEAMGIVNDAALARLELAEALLADGKPAEVPSLLDGLALTFASEGMMHQARLALAYLREAVAATGVTPQLIPLIRYVRTYLDALPTEPSRPFEPPN